MVVTGVVLCGVVLQRVLDDSNAQFTVVEYMEARALPCTPVLVTQYP